MNNKYWQISMKQQPNNTTKIYLQNISVKEALFQYKSKKV